MTAVIFAPGDHVRHVASGATGIVTKVVQKDDYLPTIFVRWSHGHDRVKPPQARNLKLPIGHMPDELTLRRRRRSVSHEPARSPPPRTNQKWGLAPLAGRRKLW